jgi:hypothetical protein
VQTMTSLTGVNVIQVCYLSGGAISCDRKLMTDSITKVSKQTTRLQKSRLLEVLTPIHSHLIQIPRYRAQTNPSSSRCIRHRSILLQCHYHRFPHRSMGTSKVRVSSPYNLSSPYNHSLTSSNTKGKQY